MLLSRKRPLLFTLQFVLFCVVFSGCSNVRYLKFWQEEATTADITTVLPYEFMALNAVPAEELAVYCQQLPQHRADGYQLYLLQLSCTQRWLAAIPHHIQLHSTEAAAIHLHNQALLPLIRLAQQQQKQQSAQSLPLRVKMQLEADESGLPFHSWQLVADTQSLDSFTSSTSQQSVLAEQMPGLGVPLIGIRPNTLKQLDRFRPHEGIFRPLTVIALPLQFTANGIVLPLQALLMNNSRRFSYQSDKNTQHLRGDGQSYALTQDLASPFLLLTEMAQIDQLEISGLFNPDSVDDKFGIYSIQALDADKMPILMIHGLNSNPLIWRRLSWAILSDPQLSQQYQIWHVFYPSGPPPFYNAMRLRQQLKSIYQQTGFAPDSKAQQMLVVGHSMGGLISRALVTDSQHALWQQTFKVPAAQLNVSPGVRQQLLDILQFKAVPQVKAAFFLDTPHRGSDSANSILSRMAASMVTMPKKMLLLFSNLWQQAPKAQLTPQMRPYMTSGNLSSLDVLSPEHPLLLTMADLPLAVPAYSLIGNINAIECLQPACPKPLPARLTDGVVPYQSAHLPIVQQELLLSSNHNSYQSPAAIAFLLQQFRLYLKQNP